MNRSRAAALLSRGKEMYREREREEEWQIEIRFFQRIYLFSIWMARARARVHGCARWTLWHITKNSIKFVRKPGGNHTVSGRRPERTGEERQRKRERKRKCAKESERENSLFSVRTGMLYFILGPVHINGEQREIFFFFRYEFAWQTLTQYLALPCTILQNILYSDIRKWFWYQVFQF